MMETMNMKTNGLMAKLGLLVVVVAAVVLGGCSSTLYKPEIAQATPNKDGIFFVDLRVGPWEIDSKQVKDPVARLLAENCKLATNSNHPVCVKPSDFVVYNGQLRNALWGKGPVFMATFVPKSLKVTAFAPPSEKDGDIVRARVIPGQVSMLAYDGVIERHDDPNRACKWEGSHNYSGGVVCPKYGYDHKDLDISKL